MSKTPRAKGFHQSDKGPPRRAPERTEGHEGPPLGDLARHVAMRIAGEHARNYPELHPKQIREESLEPLDAAFVHTLIDNVLRRWLTIEHLVSPLLGKPCAGLEPKMRGVLLVGSAQLLFLDRVPAHAAINHAVEWAKRRIRPGAGGLANAVLRKVAALRAEGPPVAYEDRRDQLPLADGQALKLTAELLPEDPRLRIMAATGLPAPLFDAWASRLGEPAARELALHSLTHPPIILSTAFAREPLGAESSAYLTPHAQEGHHVFAGPHEALLRLLGARKDVWVQDPASSQAIRSVTDLKPDVIVDLCAGQGTKTRQLAATFPKAKIYATDIDKDRFETLRESFAGSGQVTVMKFNELKGQMLAKADLVLLDVPCTNTGVLPRRPEARHRFSAKAVAALADIQRQIIADAIPLVRTGSARGKILLSTCSLEPAENSEHAAWAVKWHRFTASRETLTMPRGGPGGEAREYRDGAYSVLLE